MVQMNGGTEIRARVQGASEFPSISCSQPPTCSFREKKADWYPATLTGSLAT